MATAANAEVTVRQWLRGERIGDCRPGSRQRFGSVPQRKDQSAAAGAMWCAQPRAKPWAPEFMASLPVAGIDGGMQRRLASPR